MVHEDYRLITLRNEAEWVLNKILPGYPKNVRIVQHPKIVFI